MATRPNIDGDSFIDDDIIDLSETEIVEEGRSAHFRSDTFPGENGIDFGGLDDLLAEESAPAAGPGTARPGLSHPSSSMPPASDTDLDYLDDMLTSLQAPPSPEASSLDVLLGDIHLDIPEMPAPSARPAPSAPAPARENVSPSFEVPGLGADLFDAPSEAPHDAPRDPFDFSTGELDFSLPDPGIGDALSGALADDSLPGNPESATPSDPERQIPGKSATAKEVTVTDLEIISARLDVLEGLAAGAEGPALDPAQVLAALPENPGELPFTAALRTDILGEAGRLAEEKIQAGSVAPQVEELRRALDALSARLEVLENRPEAPTRVEAEQILAALPENPGELPFVAALRADILGEADRLAEEKIQAGSSAPQWEELRQALDTLLVRFELLEGRPVEPGRVTTEQILAALPENPGELPFTAALRAEFFGEMDEYVSVSTGNIDDLQQAVDALQDRVATLNESQARLAATPMHAAPIQELGAELAALRETLQQQENTLSSLREALAAKDAEIATLRASEELLRRNLDESDRVRAESLNALRTDLETFVQEQVPEAAAKIIREEIQGLLRDMDS